MPSIDLFLKILKENLPDWRSDEWGIMDHREHDWVIRVIEL